MRTDQAKLMSAVRFSQMKLVGPTRKDGTPITAAREGDILNLKDDLLAFLNLEMPEETGNSLLQTQVGSLDDRPGQIYAFPDTGTPNISPKDYTIEQLIRLQKECSRVLEAAADGYEEDQVPISLKLSLLRGPESRCTSLFLTGPFRDIFLFTLFHLINAAERNTILRCPEPNCRRIFYRIRKQQFCSHRCAVRASVRRKEEALAKHRARKTGVKIDGRTLEKRKESREKPSV